MSLGQACFLPALAASVTASVLLVALCASPALATLPNCTTSAITGFAPAGMTISSVTDVPASPPTPEYCDVKGSIETHNNTAGFESQLPANWNSKYLQFGCGGFCGSINLPPSNEGLIKGYVTSATDDGHETTNGFDASWVLDSNGQDKLIDFAYRAVHTVSVAVKQLAENYYSGTISESYFSRTSVDAPTVGARA